MADIIILNGAARRNGNTAALIRAFTEGAESAGNKVTEFYIQDMDIHGCIGCDQCSKAPEGAEYPCSQNDDMRDIYVALMRADVCVFASPVYFWTVSGPLKTVADRFHAAYRNVGAEKFRKKSVLLMTAGGSDYSQPLTWYGKFESSLGWENLGEVLGAGKEDEARELGASVK
jgi:multimeric flavodoxin WrbA